MAKTAHEQQEAAPRRARAKTASKMLDVEKSLRHMTPAQRKNMGPRVHEIAKITRTSPNMDTAVKRAYYTKPGTAPLGKVVKKPKKRKG